MALTFPTNISNSPASTTNFGGDVIRLDVPVAGAVSEFINFYTGMNKLHFLT